MVTWLWISQATSSGILQGIATLHTWHSEMICSPKWDLQAPLPKSEILWKGLWDTVRAATCVTHPWIKWVLGWNWNSLKCYLHDSDLLLQVNRYDCNTGQGHEMSSVQAPKKTELVQMVLNWIADSPLGLNALLHFSQPCWFWFWRQPSHPWLQATYTVHNHII